MTRRVVLLLILGMLGALALVAPASAGGGCHAPSTEGLTATDSLDASISECTFKPTVTYVDRGESVTWTNNDVVPHTVTGAARSWGTEDALDLGASVTYTFDKEGVFPYYCAYHPTMVGAVVVGDGEGTDLTAAGAIALAPNDPSAETRASDPSTTRDPSSTGVATLLAALVALAAGAAITWRLAAARRRAPSV